MHQLLTLAAAMFLMALPALAETGDAVHFFSGITVAEGQQIHDAICFFCSVDVEGTVTGDVVTFFGSSRISGHAEKDVVNFLGSAEVEGSVGKDLVVFLGSGRLRENASVGHDMVVFAGSMVRDPASTVGHDSVHFPGFVMLPAFVPPVVIVIGILFFVRWVRRRNEPYYPYSMPPPPRR